MSSPGGDAMDFLTRFGLDKSRFTLLMMLIILVVGLSSYASIPKRENPAITIRTAVVLVTFEGMSPERIENLIAIPIERRIREIAEVEDIETIITTGQALFYVYLYDNINGPKIDTAWEDLRNKMISVQGELPDGTSSPVVNTDYGDVSIATVALTGDGFSLAELEDVADDLRTDLYTVDGISKVSFYGEQEERIWLELDTRKLATSGVQLQQLLDDLQSQNVILPAGEIDAQGTSIALEANGDLETVDEIRNVLTKVSGVEGFVRLADLVEVRRGYVDPKETPVFFNGRPAIVLAVEMSETTDIQDLGVTLDAALVAFEQSQPIGISLEASTYQASIVNASVNNALSNVGQTFVVVFLVMFVFLGLRAAFVIACIIPFTVCFALAVMPFVGVDIEQVSIAAVIISLGLLVDNGLVVVEDIEGRINEGVPARVAAQEAGAQYFVPLGVASITTISAFLPMLMLEGVEGEFAFSLGAVVTAMLLGSWLTAMYVLPFLCAWILKAKKEDKGDAPSGSRRGLGALYGRVVRGILPLGLPIGAIALVGIVFSATQFSHLKVQQFPFSERADFLIYMDMPKGTAISATEEMALRVQEWLTDPDLNPGVLHSTAYVGNGGPRFNLGLNPADPDPSSAFIAVKTVDLEQAIETADRSRAFFQENLPEARFRVTRLSQGGSESGTVDVEISGPDAEVLLAAASTLEQEFATLPALVKNESNWGNKIVKVVIDVAQDKARELQITSEDISSVLETYFTGTEYSVYREGDEQIPIVMRADRFSRDTIEDLANMSITNGETIISVDQVASFKPKLEYSELRRENQVRQIIVSAKSSDYSAQETLAFIQPTIDRLALGDEYQINIGGEIEDSNEVNAQMGGNLPFALGVMLAALVFQFNSLRRSLITFLTIPLIIIGAPYLMIVTSQPFSFFAMLGLMSLMGIIINNAIVLINQIDIERETKQLDEAIVDASRKRVRPIMLTSLTTSLGLLPMALGGGALFEPMATIMIGGLLVASLITLFFVPAIYRLFMGWDRRKGALLEKSP